MADLVLLIVRGAVALSCGAAGVLALTHWLVRRGTLAPFGAWPRLVRGAAEIVVRPMEQRLVARGGNPQVAPYWVLGIAVVGGLVLISFLQWIFRYGTAVGYAARGGPRGVLVFLVTAACDLLILALFIRVIGSWFGVGRWTPWMRPFHVATDWLVRPLQRFIPPVGMVDFTPIVAYLLIVLLLKPILLGLVR